MYATFDNVRNALHLAWKYKILWVFALIAVGGSFNGSGGGNSGDSKVNNEPDSQTTPENTVQQNLDTSEIAAVLGTATAGYSLEQFIPNIAVISVSLLIAVATGIFVSVVVKNWAFGSLIYGTDIALKNGPISLKELSDRGVSSVWRLVKFQILLFLIFFGITLLLASLTVITYLVTNSWSSGGSIFAIFLSALLFILTLISMVYASLYASRYMVLNDKGSFEALKLGLRVFTKNVGNSIKLSLANCLVQTFMGIGIAMVFILAFAIGAGFFSNTTNESVQIAVGLLMGVIALPMILAVVAAFMALMGYLTTYQNITWTTLFNYIEGRGEKNE